MSDSKSAAPTAERKFSRRSITVDQWNEEGVRRYGRPARKWQFVCPSCRTAQSGEDLFALGLDNDIVLGALAFSCIGRFRGATKGCDWTLGGLLHIHELEIVDENGKAHPRFEFANYESGVES
ncbi:MAG: VVA0879 family protein [Chthoniobacter sp.]|nr:VVA0879 family protein [Chthoniobacter sp.]